MSSTIKFEQIQNLTSGTRLFSASEGGTCEIVEYDNQSIACHVPQTDLVVESLLSLTGFVWIGDEALPFNATGKAISTSADEVADLTRVQIHLNQFDKRLWASFLVATQREQSRVDALLAAMRGEHA